jgi:hypothetical protein
MIGRITPITISGSQAPWFIWMPTGILDPRACHALAESSSMTDRSTFFVTGEATQAGMAGRQRTICPHGGDV